MPSSICCTNCRTKYSLLNREAGCSKCALSFCKKCLGYRAVIPTLSDQPMIVCYNCYQKLEAAKIKPEVIITSTPLPNAPRPGGQNWWGEGLPPPSFRQGYASTSQPPIRQNPPQPNHDLVDLERRRAQLRQDSQPAPRPQEPLTVEEIEERLAKLRGCDVEQIRNPRSWFHSSEPVELNSNSNNPADLIRQAQDRARIEEKEEATEKKDWDELEERRRRIFEQEAKEVEQEEGGVRESVVSGVSEFSEATKKEMSEIHSMLEDAEKRVAETKMQEEHDAAEMRTLMRNIPARQKSLDAMQWNEKITKEIGGFWDRRNEKEGMEDEEDDEKSLDEETFKKILHEAENAPDLPNPTNKKSSSTSSENSPKKKGFFGKFFSRESKK